MGVCEPLYFLVGFGSAAAVSIGATAGTSILRSVGFFDLRLDSLVRREGRAPASPVPDSAWGAISESSESKSHRSVSVISEEGFASFGILFSGVLSGCFGSLLMAGVNGCFRTTRRVWREKKIGGFGRAPTLGMAKIIKPQSKRSGTGTKWR